MKRTRGAILRTRGKTYTEAEVKQMILDFYIDRFNPAKGGFYEMIYNNTIPRLDDWFIQNKK